MKISADLDSGELVIEDASHRRTVPLYSSDSFAEISRLWLKVGWAQRYTYAFTWLGVPIIQLPEDIVRVQEAVVSVKPDVIIETGIAHGGSLMLYASLCKCLGKGRVIGVDIDIRDTNRQKIETHPLRGLISLVEGDSTDPQTVRSVRDQIRAGEKVMVVLDSNHSRTHVLAELDAYGDVVTAGSYLVAADGIMRDLAEVPGGSEDWFADNPAAAAREFAARRSDYVLAPPPRLFNESLAEAGTTYWSDAWLKRVAP